MTMGCTGRIRLETSNGCFGITTEQGQQEMTRFADSSPLIVFFTLPSPIILCRDGDSDALIDVDNLMNIKLDCRCSKRPTHSFPH